MSLDEDEKDTAKILANRLAKILPELKFAQENAKDLAIHHGWDVEYFDMAEAYMTLADVYIGVRNSIEDENE